MEKEEDKFLEVVIVNMDILKLVLIVFPSKIVLLTFVLKQLNFTEKELHFNLRGYL